MFKLCCVAGKMNFRETYLWQFVKYLYVQHTAQHKPIYFEVCKTTLSVMNDEQIIRFY